MLQRVAAWVRSEVAWARFRRARRAASAAARERAAREGAAILAGLAFARLSREGIAGLESARPRPSDAFRGARVPHFGA